MTDRDTVLPHLSRTRSARKQPVNQAGHGANARKSIVIRANDTASYGLDFDNKRRPSNRFHRTFVFGAERVLALLVSLAAMPLMLTIAALVLILDGRPIFYRQDRVGRGGKLFRIWKFRTMGKDAESKTGPVWCTECDVRITTLGRILRASHLDELPQLFNILQGDMKFVGPRPERPEFVHQLASEVPGYMQRLRVHPGVTGIAQIRQGYDQSISDVRRKVAMDIWYIRRASLSFDMLIIAATIPRILNELWEHTKRVLYRQVNPKAPVMTYDVIRKQVEASATEALANSIGQPHVNANGSTRQRSARDRSEERIQKEIA